MMAGSSTNEQLETEVAEIEEIASGYESGESFM